ncbi:MAG: type II 3-dehydroquinate dehydratase [Firmicutes bacterium]|nr:type II 3-dehydroquinate dehydratase [Bacillota bacterium]
MKILILNGPNLNLLGQRDKEIYGAKTLEAINRDIMAEAKKLGLSVDFHQSNSEGEIIDCIQKFDGDAVIINAGAYSHYSIAIADALRDCKKIKIEVHLSNIFAREEFRRHSMLSAVCDGIISGFSEKSYLLALQYLATIKPKK